MKIRTSIRAGGKGCSPEAQAYMQKALNMQNKVANCTKKPIYQEPVYGYVQPGYQPSYVGSGTSYPDMSGACG